MSLLPFLLLVCVPGAILTLAVARRPLGLHAWIALPPSLGVLLTGAVGVGLACAGLFSLRWLAVAEALILLPVAAVAIAYRRPRVDGRRVRLELRLRAREHGVLLLLLLAALVLYDRPSEWVLSDGMDAANYVVQAAHEARRGSLFLDDAPPPEWAARFPSAVYCVNSTTGLPADVSGRRQFPFPPLFKTVLAVAFLVGGPVLVLQVPLLLGLLACLSAHVALSRIAATRAHALVGTGLLLLSPLLLKSLRITMAEICLLLVATTGLALLQIAGRSGSRATGLLAGAVLGLAMLVRLDGVLLYAGGLLVLITGSVPWTQGRRDVTPWFGTAFFAVSIASWCVALYTSFGYLDAQLRGRTWLLSAAVACAPIAWGAVRLAPAHLPPLAARARLSSRYAAGLFGAYAVFVLAVRPLVRWAAQAGGFVAAREPALVVLAYVSALTTVLGIAGVVIVLAQRARPYRAWVCLFIVGAIVYMYDLHHRTGAYWSSRRLLVTALPLLVAGTVRMLELRPLLTLRGVPRPLAVVVLAASLAAHDVRLVQGRGIQYVGAARSFAAVAAAFAPSDLLVVDGTHPLASALHLGLRYLYGLDALALYPGSLDDVALRAMLADAVARGRRVAFVGISAQSEARLRRLFVVRAQEQVLEYENRVGGRRESCRVGLRWLWAAQP